MIFKRQRKNGRPDGEALDRLVRPPAFWSSPLTFLGSVLFLFLFLSGAYTALTGSWSPFYQLVLLAHAFLGLPFTFLFFVYVFRHLKKAFGTARPMALLLALTFLTFVLTPTGPVITQKFGVPRLDMILFFASPVLFVLYVFRINRRLERPKDRIVLAFGFLTLFLVAGLALSGPFFMLGSFCYPGGYPYVAAHRVVGIGVGATLAVHMAFQWRMRKRQGVGEAKPALVKWGLPAALGIVFLALAIGAEAVREPIPGAFGGRDLKYEPPGKDSPFYPSRAVAPAPMDARLLGRSASCGTKGCHPEIHAQWVSSAHGLSGGPVVAAVEEMYARRHGVESARFCGGCHAPVALLSGEYDSSRWVPGDLFDSEAHREGVSCMACHAMTDAGAEGNGSYAVAPRKFYIFEFADFSRAGRLNEIMIHDKPDLHKTQFNRLSYKLPRFCAPCHRQFAQPPFAPDSDAAHRVNDSMDRWETGPYFTPERTLLEADLKAPSYKARVNRLHKDRVRYDGRTCQDCHMAFLEANLYDDYFFDHRFIGSLQPDLDYAVLSVRSERGKRQRLPEDGLRITRAVDDDEAQAHADRFLNRIEEEMASWPPGAPGFPRTLHARAVRYHDRDSSLNEAALREAVRRRAAAAGARGGDSRPSGDPGEK